MLAMKDEAFGLPDIVPITKKYSKDIALLVKAECFYRYPQPINCIHDNGTEFAGEEMESNQSPL